MTAETLPPTTEQAQTARDLARWLAQTYPALDPVVAMQITLRAYRGLVTFDLADDENADELWRTIAERDARLRLGLDHEDARMDPQVHPPRRQP